MLWLCLEFAEGFMVHQMEKHVGLLTLICALENVQKSRTVSGASIPLLVINESLEPIN